MKQKIENIISRISQKSEDLVEDTKRSFSKIQIPSEGKNTKSTQAQDRSMPPISKILYCAGAASLIPLFSTDGTPSKLLWGTVALACAYGGYKLNHKSSDSNNHDFSTDTEQSFDTIKSVVCDKVFSVVKNEKEEWDKFMEGIKKEVQDAIATSNLTEDQKDQKLSKTFAYEIIQFSLSEFTTKVNNLSNNDYSALKSEKEKCLRDFIKQIEETANKQALSYKQLVEDL